MSKDTKPKLVGIDPTKPFYIAVTVANIDGSIEVPAADGVEGCCTTESEAVQMLKDVNEDYPTLDGYVYRCVPVKKVWRGRTRVTPMKVKP